MFRTIFLENFRSYARAELDLTDGNVGRPNHIGVLYGANGSGKSNLVDSAVFLKMSVRTLDPEVLAEGGSGVAGMAAACRAYGSEGPMVLRYDFTRGREDGSYLMEFDEDGALVREKLDYVINKNSGCIFDISKDNMENGPAFSRQLFKTIAAKELVEHQAAKLWGKHTLLSIIRREMEESGDEAAKELIGTGILDFISAVDDIVICRPEHESMGPTPVDRSPGCGITDDEESLSAFEKAASAFVSSTFAGISGVGYATEETEDGLEYSMFVRKENGMELDIDDECLGIRESVRILPALLKGAGGGTVLIDSVEYGLNEVVLRNLFENCLAGASGQIIATTQSTVLLERANPHCVFMVDNGSITPITAIERTQKNHNNRSRYFKGVFGALPDPAPMDLAELAESMAPRKARTSYNTRTYD